MTATALLIAALSAGIGPDLDHERLLRAFAAVESSGRNPAPYQDRGQISWGRYAFGKTRWMECGGRAADWGRAGTAEQDRVMRQAIRWYAARAARRGHAGEAAFNFVARCHNGQPSSQPNGYTRKVMAAYRKQGK